VLYRVVRTSRTNRANVTGKTGGWNAALNAPALYYSVRITEN
jgi:putative transposase